MTAQNLYLRFVPCYFLSLYFTTFTFILLFILLEEELLTKACPQFHISCHTILHFCPGYPVTLSEFAEGNHANGEILPLFISAISISWLPDAYDALFLLLHFSVLIIVVSDATCQNRLVALNRLQNLKCTRFNLVFFFFLLGVRGRVGI